MIYVVRGFEPGSINRRCFKRILYGMIPSILPRQGQIPCIELGIELFFKRLLITLLTMALELFCSLYTCIPSCLLLSYQIIMISPKSHMPVKVFETRGAVADV